MIVKPGLEIHPKFIGLARQVGGEGKALLILYRLWEHCQVVKKGEFWGRVSVSYVESIARWRGKQGVCFEALRYPLGREEHGAGWVEMDPEGGVTIHGWDEANRGLLSARVNGSKGGRPSGSGSRQDGNPPVNRSVNLRETGRLSGAEPTRARREGKGVEGSGVPPTPSASQLVREAGGEERPGAGQGGAADAAARQEQIGTTRETSHSAAGPTSGDSGGEEELAEIPTVGEMFEFFQARGQGVPLRTCENYARWAGTKRLWILKDGRGNEFVRPWRKEVAEWAVKDRAEGNGMARQESRPTSGGATSNTVRDEMEAIEAEMQWQKDPVKVAALQKRYRELKG